MWQVVLPQGPLSHSHTFLAPFPPPTIPAHHTPQPQALHLGVIKVIGNLPQWSRVLQELTQIVKDIDAGG